MRQRLFAVAAALAVAAPAAVLAQAEPGGAPREAAAAPVATSPTAPPSFVAEQKPTETVIVLEKEPKPEPPSHRELAGHLFLPSHLVDDPFSYTSFGMTFGLGAGDALGPVLNLGPPPSITGDSKYYGYTGLGLGFEFQARILEYLSMRAAVAADAYLGTGRGSVLVVGTQVRASGDLGLKGSLPVGKNFRFALSVDAIYGPAFNVLLAQGIVEAIDACRADPTNCTLDPGQFMQETDTLTWNLGLAGSWAPTAYLGLTLNARYLNPTKVGNASYSKNGGLLAGALEFDARPLVHWLPVGVNFAYSMLAPLGNVGVTRRTNYGVGLYYTGRKDLALGLEIDWLETRLQDQLASNSTLAWVNLRYYW